MKHQTPQIAKFKKLKRRLGITKTREVIGLLESLWILTQTSAPCGDLGRDLDDEDIAIELEWDGAPEELIDALVDTGWIDRCKTNRLVVHDWEQHAPRYIHGVAAKKGGFVVADYSDGLQTPTTVDDQNKEDPVSAVENTDTNEEDCRDDADYSPPLQSASIDSDYSRQQPNLTKPNLTKRKKKNIKKKKQRAPPKPVRDSPPTVEEVRAYMHQMEYPDQAEYFVDYHTAGRWMLNDKKPMYDWQAAVRTFEKNRKKWANEKISHRRSSSHDYRDGPGQRYIPGTETAQPKNGQDW